MVVAASDPSQSQRLAGFLKERPAVQIKPSIVPKIADEPWSKGVFAAWEENEDISKPVKNAMKARRGNGNVSVK